MTSIEEQTRYVSRATFDKVAAWLCAASRPPAARLFSEKSTPTGKTGHLSANFCAPLPLSAKREYDTAELREQIIRLQSLVIEALGGNKLRLLGDSFTSAEKKAVIAALTANGFNVAEADFTDIISAAGDVGKKSAAARRRILPWSEQNRNASLNCYDYERLKSETAELSDCIDATELKSCCPTLVRIVNEAITGESDSYPGRHLPFDRLNGRWRYQCLHIMDEILCTTDRFISTDEMMELVYEKARDYGIIDRNNFFRHSRRREQLTLNATMMRKCFMNLSEMITVERDYGKKEKYKNSVYATGHGGHCYRTYDGTHKLSAFVVDISGKEIMSLTDEIKHLLFLHFNGNSESFRERFPLIFMLGNIMELSTDDDSPEVSTNKLTNTDLVTVNYRPVEMKELKERTEKAISLGIRLPVRTASGWETVTPIAIRQSRDKWVLIARAVDSPLLRLVTPDALSHSFAGAPTDRHSADGCGSMPAGDSIIGIGPLLCDKPYEVTLELTAKGIEDIAGEESVLHTLSPDISRRQIPRPEIYERGHPVRFAVYLNEDFFNELLRLDRTAKLIAVSPAEVSTLYEEFFVGVMGRERVALADRPKSSKTLKMPLKR